MYIVFIFFCIFYTDILGETLASLNLAREMKLKGKHDKALKIYQHALALNPTHPDLLNEYGKCTMGTCF